MKHYLIQYRFFRRLFKGTYYKIDPCGLPMGSFWSTEPIKSCQSIVIDFEEYLR